MSFIPKISIVGAGPGDPDLITVKGMKALASAQAVLYDALANQELLAHAPADALKIYVGKRSGEKSTPQDKIELMMVQLAYEKGHVVRLKGGDPYVFGRGHEELEFVKSFDIPVEVIPGISSAIAVSASQGVPVTRRDYSESFWVVTATTRNGAFTKDLHLAAASSATIVILMGLKKLSLIAEAFRREGKQDFPVMIVQNGTLPDERTLLSTISEVEKDAKESGIGTPATIVVGEVVSLHPNFVRSLQTTMV
ncbi:MAG: uroporphyrinogen-III C-methyltransferase [Saprospiraceae bacterium]|nr:uroporphyrinogen-III C-methyltransferase [Saprospiraceae bacterium]